MTTVALFVHGGRPEAIGLGATIASWLADRGHEVVAAADEGDLLSAAGATAVTPDHPSRVLDLVLAIGGDGTMLRAVDLVAEQGLPVLGVNCGQMGYLTEVEPESLTDALDRLRAGTFAVSERTVLAVTVASDGPAAGTWTALNEAVLEKPHPGKLVRFEVVINGAPFTSYAADGVIVSTPTGSTAYGFSAGGPVVWPDVQAILMVPLAAHALFNRPMVLSPSSTVTLDIPEDAGTGGILWCDGRRSHELEFGERVTITSNSQRVRIARLGEQPFTTRLVKKFALPVEGWRKRSEA